MKGSHFIILCSSIFLLTACGPTTTSIDQQNANPLVASRYGDELADTMANLVIQNDPIIKEPGMQQIIEKEIARGKSIAMNARETQAQGMKGQIIALKESVIGSVLLFSDTLYFSSDFEAKPGPDLHVYLTTIVDPRDETFPDATALDLGTIQSSYGAQQYNISSSIDPVKMRTLVLFDTKLRRIYGFAQLSK